LKEVACPAMATVEGLGVNPIELAHAHGEGRLWRLDKQVVVIAHEAIGMTPPPIAGNYVAEAIEKLLAIGVIEKNPLSRVTARGRVGRQGYDTARFLWLEGWAGGNRNFSSRL
jgi:hypothetical protein